MELIYSVQRKQRKGLSTHADIATCNPTLCCLSSRNILAFTTITELDDNFASSWGSHVYVNDINTPWFSHKIFSSKYHITVLEWDIPGNLLLVADSAGNVNIFCSKTNLLNEWTLQYTTQFVGEHIIKAAFFHNGRKVGLNPEKKDQILYSEKFQHIRFAPSVKKFGSVPAEGAIIISITGMLGALLIPSDFSQLQPSTASAEKAPPYLVPIACESLGPTRAHIKTVDICYGKNGHFLIAVSSGTVSLPIQCYKVSIKKIEEKVSITSQALPSFFLRDSVIKDANVFSVVKLCWVSREDADSLIVACSNSTGCLIEVWGLLEKSQNIHKIFNKGVSEVYKTVLWQHQAQYRSPAQIVSMTTTKLQINPTPNSSNYIMIGLKDNTIHCLYRDTLKQVSSTSLNQAFRRLDEPPGKMQKFEPALSHIDMSWLGNVLVGIDTEGHIYLYRFMPLNEPGNSMSVYYATTLLEYCLTTGFDWLDLLLCIKTSSIDAICDRLSDIFNRQPACVQQFHYVQHLCMKTSLYRLTMMGQSKAQDLSNLLMLHSISTAFKSLLRPSEINAHDKGPAEKLAHEIAENNTDVDKVLIHLDPKMFTVEPSTLQSLQSIIQWVADLSLHILARLPESRGHNNLRSTGYDITKDVKALNMLQELLVIIRIWGVLISSCLPTFTRSQANLDILALLFKLLSKLSQNPLEPDDSLLDDCCLLPSQVLIPQMQQTYSQTCIASPALVYQNLPIQLEYGIEPECLLFTPEVNIIENGMYGDQCLDSVRHLYLGKNPMSIKKCTRCNASSSISPGARTTAMKAWEQRWSKTCYCGGYWSVNVA
uniref:Mediator of RNA polymerase II transcription subunit 16 n=1 Tax=Xenopsylla cheopis TaxID=163159 RepID=A0A6M2DDA2_XENCH